jgi:hypothetical protein
VLGNVAKLAEEGDLEGVRTLAGTALAAQARESAAVEAEKRGADAARRNILEGLTEGGELKDLTATEQIRLAGAIRKGDAAFVTEASKIIGERTAAQKGAAQDAGQAGRAAANTEVAASQAAAGATPQVPAATPTADGAPPVPQGDDAKAKSGYDVLSEYFDWEEQQAQSPAPTS